LAGASGLNNWFLIVVEVAEINQNRSAELVSASHMLSLRAKSVTMIGRRCAGYLSVYYLYDGVPKQVQHDFIFIFVYNDSDLIKLSPTIPPRDIFSG
jgi:hypothetical protein